MSKILYVSSAVQAALMSQIFIPELIDGFWKNHRPVGHGEIWRDVEVKVSTDGILGLVGFKVRRNYNFLNLDFALPNEAKLVAVAQATKSNSNFISIKKELLELSHIVGGRLKARDGELIKLFRGNHKPGTVTYSSSKARQANAVMVAAAESDTIVLPKQTVKKTVVKKPIDATTVTKTSNGATVTRVPVNIVTE